MAEKLTIHDIARLAGVSNATVSRVLNNKPDVNAETRERVLRIVNEQNFSPSIAAAGLAGKRNRLIAVLVPSLSWPFISEMMRGVAESAEARSYEIVLYTILGEQDRTDVIKRILATKLTSGLLAIQVGQSSDYLTHLYEQGFPVTIISDQVQPTKAPWISVDNYTGALEATRHLIRLGHKRIAHIHGPKNFLSSFERYNGYQAALQEVGISPDPELVVYGDFTPIGGRQGANQLFSLAERPTAIFAASDFMAYGVVAVAERYGLRIPQDIALVGFDDMATSAHFIPALTTVRQPFYEMGQQGMQMLLSLMEGSRADEERFETFTTNRASSQNSVEQSIRVQLLTHLVVRASCGTPYTIEVVG